jgi:hypothetical protein
MPHKLVCSHLTFLFQAYLCIKNQLPHLCLIYERTQKVVSLRQVKYKLHILSIKQVTSDMEDGARVVVPLANQRSCEFLSFFFEFLSSFRFRRLRSCWIVRIHFSD